MCLLTIFWGGTGTIPNRSQEEACCQHVGLRYREPEYSISCGWKGPCGQTRQYLLGPAEDLGLYSGSNEKSLKVFNQRGYEQ